MNHDWHPLNYCRRCNVNRDAFSEHEQCADADGADVIDPPLVSSGLYDQ